MITAYHYKYMESGKESDISIIPFFPPPLLSLPLPSTPSLPTDDSSSDGLAYLNNAHHLQEVCRTQEKGTSLYQKKEKGLE